MGRAWSGFQRKKMDQVLNILTLKDRGIWVGGGAREAVGSSAMELSRVVWAGDHDLGVMGAATPWGEAVEGGGV